MPQEPPTGGNVPATSARKLRTFNINHPMRIKLTELGVAILREQHDALRPSIPDLGDFVAPAVDPEGWSSMTAWDVMRSLGHALRMGGPHPIEMTIAFDEQHLEPIPLNTIVGPHLPITQIDVTREIDGLQALALRCDQRSDQAGYVSAHGAAELIGLLWDALHPSGGVEVKIEDTRRDQDRDRNLDRRIRDIVRAELRRGTHRQLRSEVVIEVSAVDLPTVRR